MPALLHRQDGQYIRDDHWNEPDHFVWVGWGDYQANNNLKRWDMLKPGDIIRIGGLKLRFIRHDWMLDAVLCCDDKGPGRGAIIREIVRTRVIYPGMHWLFKQGIVTHPADVPFKWSLVRINWKW